MKTKSKILLDYLHAYYSDSKCGLVFSSDLECLCAILLSAQTTDASVNKATPKLFEKYKTAEDLANAKIEDIEDMIHSLGLYRNKALNLKNLGSALLKRFNGEVPHDFDLLKSLPGVGSKTAGVFLLERDNRASIPVDTHIGRISSRLQYVKNSETPIQKELKLEKEFPKDEWKFLHHSLIWFGRKECKAVRPDCSRCPMGKYCLHFKNALSTTDK